MKNKKQRHPALALFTKLFEEAAKDPGPYTVSMYVKRWTFQAECKKAGIEMPDNPIRFMEWEEEIGLREHVRKTCDAYRRKHGIQLSPEEKNQRKARKLI